MDIAFVLALLVAAIVLFSTEKLSVDLITLLLLVALVGKGILDPQEAFAGFSNEIIVILASIFVISGALQETGALDLISRRLMRAEMNAGKRLLSMMMLATGTVSAFMNNTTVTALFLAPVVGLARRLGVSPSKLLMPLAFASILGGTCTLIGTSTNVAVSGYLAKAGFEPLGFFEIAPVGIVALLVGTAYMSLVGSRMLKDREEDRLSGSYGIREYLSEIVVMPNSPLIGQKSFESDLTLLDFRILKILRGDDAFLPDSRLVIERGDILLVEGKIENLVKVKKIEGIEIKADAELGDKDLKGADFRMAEVLITPHSGMAGRTLKELDFRARYGLIALAIYRHGQTILETLGNIVLREGDSLLVQGPESRFEARKGAFDFAVLGEVKVPDYQPRKGLLAVGFFVAAIGLGTFGVAPLSVCFLAAALAVVLTGSITIEKAHGFIDWRLLILIGGMTAFGTAMEKTGAAELLAGQIVGLLSPFGVMAVMAGFFAITILLTQPMSNAAAALVVLPVAIHSAHQLGADPRTFGIGVMLAASISFIAPFEPSCVLVYGPGRYRFFDFVKVGLGLTLVLAVVVLFLLPVFWPLR
jgi:di/tricarboxylate transporter